MNLNIITKRTTLPAIILLVLLPIKLLSQKPIKLNFIVKYIEKHLSTPDYPVHIEDAALTFEPALLKPMIIARGIELKNPQSTTFKFDKAEIGLDVSNIISFRPKFGLEVYLNNININLDRLLSQMNYNTPQDRNFDLNYISQQCKKTLNILPISNISLEKASIIYNGITSNIARLVINIGTDTSLDIEDENGLKALSVTMQTENPYHLNITGNIYDKAKLSIDTTYDSDTLKSFWKIDEISVEELLKIWPRSIIASTRIWIEESLKKGSFSNIQGEYLYKTNQASEISLLTSLKDGSILYIKNAPTLEDINANITLKGNEMIIEAISSHINKVPVKNLKATITDISQNAELSLYGEIAGNLAPIADIAIAHAKSKPIHIKNANGDANVTIQLKIPLVSNDASEINVAATLKNVAAENIKDGHSIKNGEFSANYNNGNFSISGVGIIDNLFTSKISYIIPLDNKVSSKTEISDTASITKLKELGISVPPFIKGKIPFTYSEVEEDGHVKKFIEIKIGNNIDTKHSSISILNLESLNGVFSTEIITNADGTITLKDYKLKSQSIQSAGTIELNQDHSILSVNSSKTKLNKADFSFFYQSTDQLNSLNITGERFDITGISFDKLLKRSADSKKPFQLTSSLKKIGMHNEMVLTNPKFSAKCSHTLCTSIVLNGIFNDGTNFNINYEYPDFAWYGTNAGNSLRALDLYTKMNGGLLSFKAKMNGNTGVTNGSVNITDYHLMKSSFLSSLLTLTATSSASFRGMADMINGKGIGFKKLNCNLVYAHNLVILDNCTQDGDILNMTADGTMNLSSKTIDIYGILSPVNFINTISRNTPILKQLSGGKNTGLIAMNYTMKGSFENDPKINVNPLSILSPGFLKGIGTKRRK